MGQPSLADFPLAPALNRSGMAPRAAARLSDTEDRCAAWRASARRRRAVLAALVLAQSAVATYCFASALPSEPVALQLALVALFAILWSWLSACFWTGLAGAMVLVRGDPYAITAPPAAARGPIDPSVRTAVVMPIRNENVQRVFAGLRAVYRSLARTGELARFDFFVLSDTDDPDTRVAEAAAWRELVADLDAAGRIFYRWRRHRIKKKAGNVADFCRRWGRNYHYMVVLDADSVLTGECLTALVRLMEANPGAGIIQAALRPAGRRTLYGRIQQFAGRLYGPMLTAGMHYWQLGEAHYWGHNAIIRIAPFMEHCAIRRLRNGAEILSHDYVEAALMRRGGWAVWIAYDLPGSFEELPCNLTEELERDRRWCIGNLINARLIFAEGIHPAHRALFLTAVMAYASAPLWCMLLLLSGPLSLRLASTGLLAATLALFLVPKMLALALTLARGYAPSYGGAAAVACSAILEFLFSALVAPVRMLYHARFVAARLAGYKGQWTSPAREDNETTWRDAIERHGWLTGLGAVCLAAAFYFDDASFWWLFPAVAPLLLAVPIAVLTSRASLGERFRRAGLFLTPEEVHPPQELAAVGAWMASRARLPRFADAVVDPDLNQLLCASHPRRLVHAATMKAAARHELVERAASLGSRALSARERLALLADPIALRRLHAQILASPGPAQEAWRSACGGATRAGMPRSPAPSRAPVRPAPARAAA